MRAVDWLPIRLANSLREFYTSPPYSFDDPGANFQSFVQRGRFDSADDLGKRRLKAERTTQQAVEFVRTAAITWRLELLESEALIDGPAPAYGILFRVEVLHDDAAHCAAVMDLLLENIWPYMVSLDSIYDKDDDPTVQVFKLHACVALFSLMADGLPDLPQPDDA